MSADLQPAISAQVTKPTRKRRAAFVRSLCHQYHITEPVDIIHKHPTITFGWPENTRPIGQRFTAEIDRPLAPLIRFLNALPNTQTIGCCQKGYIVLKSDRSDLCAFLEKMEPFQSSGEVGQYELTGGIEIRYTPSTHDFFDRFEIHFYDEIAIDEMNHLCFGVEPPPSRCKFFGMCVWEGDES